MTTPDELDFRKAVFYFRSLDRWPGGNADMITIKVVLRLAPGAAPELAAQFYRCFDGRHLWYPARRVEVDSGDALAEFLAVTRSSPRAGARSSRRMCSTPPRTSGTATGPTPRSTCTRPTRPPRRRTGPSCSSCVALRRPQGPRPTRSWSARSSWRGRSPASAACSSSATRRTPCPRPTGAPRGAGAGARVHGGGGSVVPAARDRRGVPRAAGRAGADRFAGRGAGRGGEGPETLLVYRLDEAPEFLTHDLPPDSSVRRCLFFTARDDSPAVDAMLAAIPEDDHADVAAAMEIAHRVTAIAARSEAFANTLRPDEVPRGGALLGGTYVNGFHGGDAEAVERWLEAQGLKRVTLRSFLDRLILLRALDEKGAPLQQVDKFAGRPPALTADSIDDDGLYVFERDSDHARFELAQVSDEEEVPWLELRAEDLPPGVLHTVTVPAVSAEEEPGSQAAEEEPAEEETSEAAAEEETEAAAEEETAAAEPEETASRKKPAKKAAKRAAAKKSASKKSASKKAGKKTAAKTASKKTASKKTAGKKAAKKTAAKKSAAKKTAAKKSASKKTAAKKSASKKTAAKKTAKAGKKSASKKSASKKTANAGKKSAAKKPASKKSASKKSAKKPASKKTAKK
ncbi:hypothetical protein [Nannocystis pusilla]|uniref:hypothetical protein n=1 Tax=Nannocystis pusilla TaxID=889268 RepID=UPI003B77A5D9